MVEQNVNRDEIIVLDGYLKFDEYTNRISFRAKSINTIEDAINFQKDATDKDINTNDETKNKEK